MTPASSLLTIPLGRFQSTSGRVWRVRGFNAERVPFGYGSVVS